VNFKGQHIGNFLTFLAGLIILAHAVVPHHHHSEITHLSEQESTCEIPAQEKNTDNQDSHCHAFNTLVSEKTTNSIVNQALSEYFNSYIAGINTSIEIPPVKKVTTTIFGDQAIFIKQFFVTAQSLRAPPVNA
jgi:ribosomal protein L23